MTNYYEELHLNRESNLNEINEELSRLESAWKRREITNSEKATKILVLIIDAKKVFKTDASRREYDILLAQDKESAEKTEKAEKKACFTERLAHAKDYMENQQFDLAKVAIDKAIELAEYSDDLGELYDNAGKIYSENGLFEAALEFMNKAIETSQDLQDTLFYIDKAHILYQLISSLKQSDLDASKHIENYRITCQVCVKKIKEQCSKELAYDILVWISHTYCDSVLENYDLAEQYARQALTYDENGEEAKEILRWLDAPKEVSKEKLQRYVEEEVSPFESEVALLIEKIISGKVKPEYEPGWIMISKECQGELVNCYPATTYNTKEVIKIVYALSEDGTFIKQVTTELYAGVYSTDNYNPKGSHSHSGRPLIQEPEYGKCTLAEMMTEMDFDVCKYQSQGYNWRESNTFCDYGYFSQNKHNLEVKKLVRNYRKKGQGLYNRLKEVATYIEECKRINEEYEAELVILKEKMTVEYQRKREALIAEKNRKVDEVVKSESDRMHLQNNIDLMEMECSSLGFFSRKRKKELQAKILKAKHELSLLPVVEQVITIYQKKLDELDSEEKMQFSRSKDDLRKFKYPLPQQ